MKDFNARLAKAKAKPRPHRDVPVCLDDELAEHRAAILKEIEAAKQIDASDQRLAGPNDAAVAPLRERLAAIEADAAESLLTLRFRRLPGNEWAALTLHHPPRPEVAVDRQWGYNIDSLCGAAAAHHSDDGTAYGFRVETDDDGNETEIPMDVATWADLFSVLSGSDVEDVRDAIWAINEHEPANRLDGLVKGFGAARSSATK